jgi:regulator of sirC expression with transglutaminase-like and TPR domain
MEPSKLGAAAAVSAAIAGLTGAGASAQATERPVPPAASYADLLEPIPNAVERLQQANLQEAQAPRLIEAQYGYGYHHHHHHYRHWRRPYHRHHHHHHHYGY